MMSAPTGCVCPWWISYPVTCTPDSTDHGPGSEPKRSVRRRSTFSRPNTVCSGSSPSPWPAPSSPSGSRSACPSICSPPQMPSTRPPRAACARTQASSPCRFSQARSVLVCLEPGRMIQSSTDRSGRVPASRTATSCTPRSAASGSNSSRLLMRGGTSRAIRAGAHTGRPAGHELASSTRRGPGTPSSPRGPALAMMALPAPSSSRGPALALAFPAPSQPSGDLPCAACRSMSQRALPCADWQPRSSGGLPRAACRSRYWNQPSSSGRPWPVHIGTVATTGTPVISSIRSGAGASRPGSPLKRFSTKPRRRLRSSSGISAQVPYRWAKAPPRSMSDTSRQTASAWRATRRFTTSLNCRLISAGDPAPSMTITSYWRRRSSSVCASSGQTSAQRARQGMPVSRASTCPSSTTWLRVSASGLSSSGFICTVGSTPAASA